MPSLLTPSSPEWSLLQSDIDLAVADGITNLPFDFTQYDRSLVLAYLKPIGSAAQTTTTIKSYGSHSVTNRNSLSLRYLTGSLTHTQSITQFATLQTFRQASYGANDRNSMIVSILIEKMFNSGDGLWLFTTECFAPLNNANTQINYTFAKGSEIIASGSPTGIQFNTFGASAMDSGSEGQIYIGNAFERFG